MQLTKNKHIDILKSNL